MHDRSWQLAPHVLQRRGLVWPVGFFTGQAGCFCCAASVTYHSFGGNKFGAIPMTNNDDWYGGSWTTRTGLTNDRYGHVATSLEDGLAYVYGGRHSASPFLLLDNDEYATSGDAWTGLTDMPSPEREFACGDSITDNYAVYGANSFSVPIGDCDAYSIGGDSWTSKTNAPTNNRNRAAASTDGTYLYTYGGVDSGSTLMRDTERYDPSGDSWTGKTDCPLPARQGASAFVVSGVSYLCGGGTGVIRDCDGYSFSGDSWSGYSDIPTPARQWFGGASVTSAGAGWITGGQDSGGARLLDHDEFVPNTWTNRTDLPSDARQWNASASC